jgi:hypothetical protein
MLFMLLRVLTSINTFLTDGRILMKLCEHPPIEDDNMSSRGKLSKGCGRETGDYKTRDSFKYCNYKMIKILYYYFIISRLSAALCTIIFACFLVSLLRIILSPISHVPLLFSLIVILYYSLPVFSWSSHSLSSFPSLSFQQ